MNDLHCLVALSAHNSSESLQEILLAHVAWDALATGFAYFRLPQITPWTLGADKGDLAPQRRCSWGFLVPIAGLTFIARAF